MKKEIYETLETKHYIVDMVINHEGIKGVLHLKDDIVELQEPLQGVEFYINDTNEVMLSVNDLYPYIESPSKYMPIEQVTSRLWDLMCDDNDKLDYLYKDSSNEMLWTLLNEFKYHLSSFRYARTLDNVIKEANMRKLSETKQVRKASIEYMKSIYEDQDDLTNNKEIICQAIELLERIDKGEC